MAQIVMLLANPFRPDPRVAREAEALAEQGHRVTIIAWDRQQELAAEEERPEARILRVQNIPSVYGGGWRQLFYTPRFWRQAVRIALELQPDVVHCHDLDTLYAGWQIKGRSGCRLVFDAHEDYPALMSLYLPAPLVWALSRWERFLLGRVDHTLTASSIFADKLASQNVSPVTTIGNYARLEPFKTVNEKEILEARARLGIDPQKLVVAYIGGFSRNRELLPLLQAAQDLPQVEILLWGDGHQRQAVERATSGLSNARYLGWLPAEQVPLYTKMADVIYYCLVSDYPGAIYNAPNTLSNAMAAGRPLIANEVGDLGRILRKTEAGLLLPEVTPQEIRAAIDRLRDVETRQRLGNAGQRAAHERYNWAAASQKLVQIYAGLALDS
jgi:glycosyltransferase involved in cell wall biosynthesis